MALSYGMTDATAVTAGSGALTGIKEQVKAVTDLTYSVGSSTVPAGGDGASAVALAQQKDSLAAFKAMTDDGLNSLQAALNHVSEASAATQVTDADNAATFA